MTVFRADAEEIDISELGVDALTVDTEPLTDDMAERLTRSMFERLEYELLGAWRMGYSFVYVCHHMRTRQYGDADAFAYEMSVKPSDDPNPPDIRDSPMDSIEQYDLRDVTRAEIQEARRCRRSR